MKKRIMAVALVVAMLTVSLCFTACGKKAKFVFESNGDGTCSVSIDRESKLEDIVIPEASSDGETVTKVNFCYFRGIKSVVIPDCVKTIGESAFGGCENLTDITFGSGLTTIEREAFMNCTALTDVVIPESVTAIGNSAFEKCDALKTIVIGGCDSEFVLADLKSLESVTFGKNVKEIQSGTIRRCPNVSSVVVDPENERYYSEGNCVIENVKVAEPYKTVLVGCKTSVIPQGVELIGGSAFNGCEGLTSISLPESVRSINDYAFGGCSGLTEVTLPDGIERIGREAFRGCTSLGEISLSKELKWIDEGAFSGSGLTTITIPASVTAVHGSAFTGCNKLTDIIFENPKGWFVKNEGYFVGNSSENAQVFSSGTYASYKFEKNS